MVEAPTETRFQFHCPSRILRNGFLVQPVHWHDHPLHDEAWADRMSAKFGGRASSGWMREFEMDPSAAGLPVWGMMARDVHLAGIPWAEIVGPKWTRWRVLDHGIRHPTCCGWVAVNSRGDEYWYRQYYATDRTIAENCQAILSMEAKEESVAGSVADPAIHQRSAETKTRYWDIYARHGMPLTSAATDQAGYDAVATSLVSSLCRWSLERGTIHPTLGAHLDWAILEELAAEPALWFHPSCAGRPQSLYEECANLRWAETRSDPLTHAQPEKPANVNDDGADVVRYGRHTKAVRWMAPAKPAAKDLLDRMMEEQNRGGDRFR
jgi:hypothetical protein